MRIGEVAELLHLHPQTVRAWTRRGLLKCGRLPTGERRFDAEEVLRVKAEIEGR